jgi:hypothetical protein
MLEICLWLDEFNGMDWEQPVLTGIGATVAGMWRDNHEDAFLIKCYKHFCEKLALLNDGSRLRQWLSDGWAIDLSSPDANESDEEQMLSEGGSVEM